MAGGKGNIKPGDGKQFSSEYQPPEKWTEKKALEMGNELIVWLKEKDQKGNDKGNIFIIDFLASKSISRNVPKYLADKFTSFRALLEIAKTIQEAKLLKYGVADRLNASMVKFCLINHHGYFNKQHIDHTSKGKNIQDIKITVADPGTIEKVKKLMEGSLPN